MNVCENTILKDDDMKPDNMRAALTAIAREIEMFNNSSIEKSNQSLTDDEEIFIQILKYKSLLKSKNKLIKKLQENIKIACFVAKTVISAKENETASLNSLLRFKRSECADLYQKQTKTSQVIHETYEQNKVLQNQLNTLTNFIELGFTQLPKSSKGEGNESSTIHKLKEIITYSGKALAKQNADYEKKLLLEQDNRFLKNQLSHLNNNSETLSNQIQSLHYQNTKLQKEKLFLKNTLKSVRNGVCSSKCQCNDQNVSNTEEVNNLTFSSELDLTAHLSMAKKLLDDQEALLQDLKYLTQAIIIT